MTEFYKIYVGMEWSHITIDEESGTFMATGSFGSFGHIWNSIGDRTLKEFLAGIDRQYFFEKTRGATAKTFDFDRSVKALKEQIIDMRRQGDLTKDEARRAWREVGWLDHTSSAHHFVDQVLSEEALGRYFRDDYWDIPQFSLSPDCVGFWEVIWTTFKAAISTKKESAA